MEELDLKELISIFMKRKVLIILVVIIFALLGAIYTLKFITPTYKSSTSLVLVQTGSENNSNLQGVDTSSITSQDVTLNSKLVDNYKKIATSKATASQVIENLNLDMSIETLQSITSVTTITDTEVLEITVEYTDPEMACKITSELANVFIENVDQIYKLNNLHILDKAEVDYEPSNIHLAKNIVIFAFVGGILVSGYILLINMLDTTVKSDTDIEKALNVPVLASIVLTNESARKNIQNQADNLYKVSGFDSDEQSSSLSESTISTNTSDSLFENYTDNENGEKSNNDVEVKQNHESHNNNYKNQQNHSRSNNYNNNNYKSRNRNKNQYKNRRKDK